MGYETALTKAWEQLAELKSAQTLTVKFLADEYGLDTVSRKVFSLACNVPAKDFTAVIILHYAAHVLKGKIQPDGEWVSFKELSGVEGYYEAFRKRAIEPIIRKYGKHPESLLTVLARLPAKKAQQGDVGIIVEVFADVPALITVWAGDDEFGPDANILFDRSITRIFCTEDIMVLAQMVAGAV